MAIEDLGPPLGDRIKELEGELLRSLRSEQRYLKTIGKLQKQLDNLAVNRPGMIWHNCANYYGWFFSVSLPSHVCQSKEE